VTLPADCLARYRRTITNQVGRRRANGPPRGTGRRSPDAARSVSTLCGRVRVASPCPNANGGNVTTTTTGIGVDRLSELVQ
jgi:hypothetical protein